MSREIKFRGWYGENLGMMTPSFNGNIKEIFAEANGVYMQYTGLKDKNGKEIFEGDVIKHPIGILAEVIFSKEFAAFLAKYKLGESYKKDLLEPITVSKCEIIGNIYENSELLEVSK